MYFRYHVTFDRIFLPGIFVLLVFRKPTLSRPLTSNQHSNACHDRAIDIPKVLTVGESLGLGFSLVELYASKAWTVYATTREKNGPSVTHNHHGSGISEASLTGNISWLVGVNLMHSDASKIITSQRQSLGETMLDVVEGFPLRTQPMQSVIGIEELRQIKARVFTKETWDDGPNFDKEVQTDTISSVAPVCIVNRLVTMDLPKSGSKVMLVFSEAGSIRLRNSAKIYYGHHPSKAALDMVRHLLSFDLLEKRITVSRVYPGLMRTDMAKNVGFDEFYDKFHDMFTIYGRANGTDLV